jgi:hypothetical protein
MSAIVVFMVVMRLSGFKKVVVVSDDAKLAESLGCWSIFYLVAGTTSGMLVKIGFVTVGGTMVTELSGSGCATVTLGVVA